MRVCESEGHTINIGAWLTQIMAIMDNLNCHMIKLR